MANLVYIATSLDGYIADKNGGLEWLNAIPNPNQDDFGFFDFMNSIDALVMGRNTFDMVCGFEGPWPYSKPVFVISDRLTEIPTDFRDKAELLSGRPQEIVEQLQLRGYKDLYIDGGITIQKFLQEGLIDDLIISRLPVVLGGGTPLFAEQDMSLDFEHVETEVLLESLVKSHYRKK